MTTWLSQNRSVGKEIGTWKSFSNWHSQTNSLVVETKAFTEDRETVVWFLAFQETKELPIKMQKLVTHFLVSKQEPQSAFEKAFNWRKNKEEKKRPWPGVDLRYSVKDDKRLASGVI